MMQLLAAVIYFVVERAPMQLCFGFLLFVLNVAWVVWFTRAILRAP